MAATTTEYYDFTGPGFLTLVENKSLVGKAPIQYKNEDDEWVRLPITIGWPSETVAVDVPNGTEWRVAVSYFDCESNLTSFAFYNADLGNQPDMVLPEYEGHPVKADKFAGSKGYTTYTQTFTGPGIVKLTAPGKLSSKAIIKISHPSTPTELKPYYVNGVQATIGTGPQEVEVKFEGLISVEYQVASRFPDDVVMDFEPVDYTGGFVPPPPPPLAVEKKKPKKKAKKKSKKEKTNVK